MLPHDPRSSPRSDRAALPPLDRREFLSRLAGSSLAAALALGLDPRLCAQELPSQHPLQAKQPPLRPRAKRVVFLFQSGGPSQLDLYDPKPLLTRINGQALPESQTRDLKLSFVKPDARVWASPRRFSPCGESGIEMSDWIPHIGSIADEICLVRSMVSEAFNHHPAQSLLMSGSTQLGRPSMGAWVNYGLGSECEDLPGFVVLSSGVGTDAGVNNWTSGFLPSTYQGVTFFPAEDPILYLSSPEGITRETQERTVAALRDLNAERYRKTRDPEIATRVSSYELALRMQQAAPELTDLDSEPESIRAMYGIGEAPMHAYATNCLLARRMLERGVRFVMVNHASWDSHTFLQTNHGLLCKTTDQPAAALVRDLKQRGLLDETLVIWGGEFGRTPMAEIRRPSEEASAGRDHQPGAFSMWLAGGGIRGGQVIGSTDEFGLSVATDPVAIHDLQATLLHCLGIDHLQLTYRHMGRDFRLTDVAGEVVEKMLA